MIKLKSVNRFIPQLWTILFLFTIGQLSAQKQFIVQSIQFDTLKKTKATYLNRFIDTKLQQPTSRDQLEKDAQQLKNLNNIANATYRVDTIAGQLKITFEIEEALTLFPIINFGGIRGNFWFQLGFNEINWLGKGMQLSAFYQNNDRRDNFNLYYQIPYIKGSRYGASISALKWASVEPLFFGEQAVFYDYDNYSLSLLGRYEISRNQILELGGTYFIEQYRKNERHIDEITPGPDNVQLPKMLGKVVHRIDRINYDYYHLSGFDNVLNIQSVYNIEDGSVFNILMNDTRYFKRFNETGNLALRFRLGISTNNDSPFAPFVLDSHVNIRGAGNRIDRGTGVLVLNLEYRQDVFDIGNWAGQIVGFSDLGTWRNPGGTYADLIDSDNFRHFVGGGIRLIYKRAFNAMLRLDYGIDIYDENQQGLVLGFGQYF